MRRRLALWLTLLLTLSLALGCTKKAPEPPKETGTTITFHYHRWDEQYQPWDLWVWPFGKEGQGFPFTEKDEYGAKAVVTLPVQTDKVGFIIRKGGDSWAGKDVGTDRFIEVKGGKSEVWLLEGEERVATAPPDLKPRIQSAYLDSKRAIVATLTHDLALKGTPAEGFSLSPNLPITSVRDARATDSTLIGYEANATQVIFILAPGKLGFRKDDQGAAKVYVSGPFNNWGGTTQGSFKAQPEWLMTWNKAASRYELTKPIGTGAGQVPLGSEFKFTEDQSGSQQWLPSSNIQITAGTDSGKGTKEVVITLAQDADVTKEYTLQHESLAAASVQKRGVLNDPAFIYTGNDLGAVWSPMATSFRLWAPTVSGVEVLVYRDPAPGGYPPIDTFPMTPAEGGTWVAKIPGNLEGKYYTYRLKTGDQTREVVDPYAIGAGVNGDRGLIVNLAATNPAGWDSTSRPPFKNPTDAILYEMHVRDLTSHSSSGAQNKGKFLGLVEAGTKGPNGVATGLDHLKELGITHIHLLPSFDYASVDETKSDQFNWGYDPKNFNLPEGSYATDPNGGARLKEFKQMVQGFHQNGIRVVMDVVYNHTSAGASPFEAIAPTYYYRYDATGKLSNGSGTGNETASERPMMRKYIVDSVKYWATEYKVDGFRFDLMALHDIETMKQVRAALDAIDPSILIYGEPWAGGSTPLPESERLVKGNQKNLGIAVFNDNIRNAIKGDNDGVMKGFATGAGGQDSGIKRGVVGGIDFNDRIGDFTAQPSESINYASAHDNLTLWDKIARSNAQDSEADRIKMDLFAQAIVFTSQGIPFMQGGEEMLRTKGGNHNSYNAPDSVNQLDWNRKVQYAEAFNYYKGLIAVRKAHPSFRLMTADQVKRALTFLDAPMGSVAFRLDGVVAGDSWKQIVVIYNPQRQAITVNLPGGTWQVAAMGQKIGTGPVADPVTGQASIPPISMMMLYQ